MKCSLCGAHISGVFGADYRDSVTGLQICRGCFTSTGCRNCAEKDKRIAELEERDQKHIAVEFKAQADLEKAEAEVKELKSQLKHLETKRLALANKLIDIARMAMEIAEKERE